MGRKGQSYSHHRKRFSTMIIPHPRKILSAIASLSLVFIGCEHKQEENHFGPPLTFEQETEIQLAFTFPVRSFVLPDEHQWNPAYEDFGGWIKQEGVDDSVVISAFDIQHADVIEANDPNGPYRDIRVNDESWRFYRHKVEIFYDEDYSETAWKIMMMLIRADDAIVLHGNLGWSDDDFVEFAKRLSVE